MIMPGITGPQARFQRPAGTVRAVPAGRGAGGGSRSDSPGRPLRAGCHHGPFYHPPVPAGASAGGGGRGAGPGWPARAGRHHGPLHHRPVPAGRSAGSGGRGAGPGRPARAGRRGGGRGRDRRPLHHQPVPAGRSAGGGGRSDGSGWPGRAGCHHARSITDPHRRAEALAAVAKALAARGDTRQARHVASAACAVGRWTMVLGLVLSLETSAIRVLTDQELHAAVV